MNFTTSCNFKEKNTKIIMFKSLVYNGSRSITQLEQ